MLNMDSIIMPCSAHHLSMLCEIWCYLSLYKEMLLHVCTHVQRQSLRRLRLNTNLDVIVANKIEAICSAESPQTEHKNWKEYRSIHQPMVFSIAVKM